MNGRSGQLPEAASWKQARGQELEHRSPSHDSDIGNWKSLFQRPQRLPQLPWCLQLPLSLSLPRVKFSEMKTGRRERRNTVPRCNHGWGSSRSRCSCSRGSAKTEEVNQHPCGDHRSFPNVSSPLPNLTPLNTEGLSGTVSYLGSQVKDMLAWCML